MTSFSYSIRISDARLTSCAVISFNLNVLKLSEIASTSGLSYLIFLKSGIVSKRSHPLYCLDTEQIQT